jgi:hypothetical protein
MKGTKNEIVIVNDRLKWVNERVTGNKDSYDKSRYGRK